MLLPSSQYLSHVRTFPGLHQSTRDEMRHFLYILNELTISYFYTITFLYNFVVISC